MLINITKSRHICRTVIWIAVIVAFVSAPAVAEENAPRLAALQLTEMAEMGRFDALLVQLRNAYPEQKDLIADLALFQEHEQERFKQRLDAYRTALEKAETEFKADHIEDALIAAIDAHSLAIDKNELLIHPTIEQITRKADSLAEEAFDKHNWVESLSLYRLLNLLYEEHDLYQDQVKEVSRHIRVLQVYTPQILDEMYRERAKKLGKEDEQPGKLDHQHWTTRLKNVELEMLRETLKQAALTHIDNQGYKPLISGAIESLMVLLDTDQVTSVFPMLNDHNKVEEFRRELNRYQAMLSLPDKKINEFEVKHIIDRIVMKNESTVDLPQEVLVYEMAEGATDTLDDFSALIWPEDLEQFSRSTSGTYKGVGIQISRRDDRLIVVSPIENTPAQRAGVKASDIIVTVDGKDTSTWSLDRAVREITGPEGTFVTLGIERVGEKEILEFKIRRAEIVIESIRGWSHGERGGWDYWIDPDNRIGYIRLSSFIPQTTDDLDDAVQVMQEDGPINGLILDLRHNPGGLLVTAIDVVDRFIEKGPIVYTVDSDGRRKPERSAKRYRTYKRFPVIILINKGSASASEIVAGALQDYDRAIVVGTRSFGKGSVQDVSWYPPNHFRPKWGLKLTTRYYMLPRGRIIHRKPESDEWGIEPDLIVEMTDQQVEDALKMRQEIDIIRGKDEIDPENPAPEAEVLLEDGVDPQLESALLILKTHMVARNIAVAHGNPFIDTP